MGVCDDQLTEKNFRHFTDHVILNAPKDIDRTTHYLSDGVFVAYPAKPSEYSVWDWDNKQWLIDYPQLENAIRAKRDGLLLSSDWTQLNDVAAETREKWINYRQALRDITKQPGYPLEVVWPIP